MVRSRNRQRGFTATEMMIVVGIVAMLAAFAAPNMAAMIRVQRLRTATFDVFSSLNFARSEAIKRNTTVTVTPTGGAWNTGWRITDSNGNVLKEQSGWDTITVTGPGTVTFAGSGRLSTVPGFFNVTSTDVDATQYRCVRIDASGRAVSKEGTC